MQRRAPILVTGASTGIGRSTALELDRRGLAVLAGVRREEDAESLRASATGNLEPVTLDVTKQESIEAALSGREALGGLVNNAGIVVAGPVEALEADGWEAQFDVNVLGAVRVTYACLPLLHEGLRVGGAPVRVVNVGSVSGRVTLPFMGPYSASKFALGAITDALRAEVSPFGLDAVIVEPGAVRTPIWDKSIGAGEERLAGAPADRADRYRAALEELGRQAARSGAAGVDPDHVGRVIARLLTARRARTRTLVGRDARALAWVFGRLPRRLRDRLVRRLFREGGGS